nr:zinc finger CCCH domain-containing protein 13 [Drosophila suzukii]
MHTAAANGGPRVSFNRDVHVKRIGKHPSEYESSGNQPSYHQLPKDIDPADIRKEAALVIAQAGRHHSKAENGDHIPNFRTRQRRQSQPSDFNSLPTRRKKGKPVTRSASDASTKKPTSKRPSIFGLFGRKSDSNVSQLDRDPRFEDGGARRLVRSKSDVGSSKLARKANQEDRDKEKSSQSKQQLSPIIEQAQREDFFERDYFRERERRKSDAVTPREKDESGRGLSELLARSRSQAELDGPLLTSAGGGGGPSISAGIRDRIETLQAKSGENMHSSQQPAERLPLTKGRTVDGLVKRLSMERFSPQPVISQPAFSYIRPNEGITYAQLDLGEDQVRRSSPLDRDVRTPQREFAPARPPRASDVRPSYSPTSNGAPLANRPSHSHSPSPWQQLSPRNLSDEDEGLGYEPRKVYYEEEFPRRAEPPIVPVHRSVSPSPYLDELGYRRAQLETRILTRRFGEGATLERQADRNREVGRPTPEREPERFHRPVRQELANEYPVERTQVDSGSTLPKMEKTSRYRHTKYYDDGHGGVKETYVRETQRDGQVRESRHRERIGERERDYNSADRLEQEPKSLDSQLTDQYRSSPELRAQQTQQQREQREDYWQSSLKRDKLQQRSFDKGDSGIENDFRKESFNGDLTSRWRKRTTLDDIRACESFLRKERRDSAQQRQLQRQAVPSRLRREHSYVYRERSIDDGSHFDPHLDKYPVATSTLRRREQHSQSHSQSQAQKSEDSSTLKRNKKLGGFEKVKQLFTGAGGSASNGGSGRSSGSNVSSGKKERMSNGNSSTLSRHDKDKEREKEKERERERYMVREEEMRSRYREHHTSAQETSREPKTIDISMRRRLSTPKASPLLVKRSPADKPPKKQPKAKESPLAKVEKTSWFRSLDRRAKSSPKELNVSVNGHSETTSSLKRTKRNPTAAPAKNLRFFGDTDLDSNPPTISKATSMPRSRPSLGQSKHSQSAYHLDRSPPPPAHDYRHTLAGQAQVQSQSSGSRQRASSMQHLDNGSDEVDFRKRRHYSRSRELHDISESGSEPEPAERHKRSSTAGQRAMSLERSVDGPRSQRIEDRPLLGPPKPARSAERRGLLNSLGQENVGYGRDRYPAESSGTEGESSLHSQRSVVYLHATTVGDIPQPYNLRRRSMSRDDLRKGKQQPQAPQQPPPLQPMTRTVSRSVSMLAPWKPKHISEGYEINYSQEQNKRMSTLPRKPPPHNGATSASTLSRLGRKNESSPSTRRYHMDNLERPPPPRSVLSASNLRSTRTK